MIEVDSNAKSLVIQAMMLLRLDIGMLAEDKRVIYQCYKRDEQR